MTEHQLTENQLARLLEVGRSLVSELDLETLLGQILETARDLTQARYAALGILDEDKSGLQRFLNRGVDDETRRSIGPLPQGRGVLGELIRNPAPLRLANVGDHPRSYGFPPGHPPMNSFVGVPIRVRGESFGNLYLTEKSGGREFNEGDEALLVILADWAAVAIDNARIHERSEQQRSEQQRTVQALEASASLSRVDAVETGSEWLLGQIVKRGRALLECRSMVAITDAGGGMRVAAAAGEDSSDLEGRRLDGEHALLVGADREARVQHVHGGQSSLHVDLGLAPRVSMVAQMSLGGRSQGFLLAVDPIDREDFSEGDAFAFESFAGSAATSLSTAKGVERDRQRRSIDAAEQERRRWARELHDDTLQDLGALKVIAESALQSDDLQAVRKAVATGAEQLEHTIIGLESLINELRPASLDELGTAAAIETLVARVNARTDMEATAEVDLAYERGDAAGRPDPALEATVYRVVQEALNNATKHSQGSRATIAVHETGDQIEIEVADDGVGFEPNGAGANRFGLHGMRERVEIANGEVSIDSAPGRGTRVRVTLPVEPRPEG